MTARACRSTSSPSTTQPSNISPWAALATNISTEYERGHFIPCSQVTGSATFLAGPGITDTYWKECHGPYENSAPGGDGAKKVEINDSPCFPFGDTHGSPPGDPDQVTGCIDAFTQNGDLDFDGTSYWADWPTGTTAGTYPGTFVQSLPTTAGSQYSQFLIQTDVALSESTCAGGDSGCAVPPPNAPGRFYPFWSRTGSGNACKIEFGNVTPGVNDMGGDQQYGADQFPTLGYDEFLRPVQDNSTCST